MRVASVMFGAWPSNGLSNDAVLRRVVVTGNRGRGDGAAGGRPATG
jgi:hypothetical protein